MDVFISWTRADEDIKNTIAERLSELNISYFDSDRDCVSNFADECAAAIKECKVFLVIISEASMSHGRVKDEVGIALDYEDLGMEAVRLVTVQNLPAYVITNDKGEDFYAKL